MEPNKRLQVLTANEWVLKVVLPMCPWETLLCLGLVSRGLHKAVQSHISEHGCDDADVKDRVFKGLFGLWAKRYKQRVDLDAARNFNRSLVQAGSVDGASFLDKVHNYFTRAPFASPVQPFFNLWFYDVKLLAGFERIYDENLHTFCNCCWETQTTQSCCYDCLFRLQRCICDPPRWQMVRLCNTCMQQVLKVREEQLNELEL